jgi:hypothetical protein
VSSCRLVLDGHSETLQQVNRVAPRVVGPVTGQRRVPTGHPAAAEGDTILVSKRGIK